MRPLDIINKRRTPKVITEKEFLMSEKKEIELEEAEKTYNEDNNSN